MRAHGVSRHLSQTTADNNTLHTEPRAARLFLLASLSPRPGERCRYSTNQFHTPEPRMSLKKCKECGNAVSTKAAACPACGAVRRKKTGCLTWLALIATVLIVIFVAAGRSAMTNSNFGRNSQAKRSVNQNTSAPKPSTWHYSSTTDKMTGRTTYIATIQSTNTVNFEFPYSGDQRGKLTLRVRKGTDQDIMFSIERGQLLGVPLETKTATVRFDDSQPREFNVADSTDHDTTIVFFKKTWDFYDRMKNAKRVRVSMPVYNEGHPVFDFDVKTFEEPQFMNTVE